MEGARDVENEKPDMKSDFEWITPERATEDLKNQIPNNRTFSISLAKMYARVMASGRWDWNNPDGLIYNIHGQLCQGQHRLMAIQMNGVKVRMYVTRNAPESVAAVLDSGRPRTTAHRLTFDGYKNAKDLAAVARQVVLWKAGRFWTHGLTPAREEIEATIETHPELHVFAERSSHWPSRQTLAPSQAGFTWWLLSTINADEADVFMTSLRDGNDLYRGHPVLVLRNRLASERSAGTRHNELRILLTLLAWRSYLRREQISKLQLPSQVYEETFRRVLGLPSAQDDPAAT